MADIFISYAREDREWVSRLANALQSHGYTVWWDWDLLVGKRYRETIETELQTCKATVVVWSQHSIRSDFVRDEAEEGQQRNILVPALKESVRPPAGFRQLQTADLTTWNGQAEHAEFLRMMKGLTHLIGAPSGTPRAAAPATHTPPVEAHPPATPPTVPETRVQPETPPPVTPTPAPKVEAKAPDSTPTYQPVPPPPLKPPSNFANIPAASNPMVRYGVIGGVALIAIILVATQFWPSSTPSKPSKSGGSVAALTGGTTGGSSGGTTGGTHGAGSTGGTTAGGGTTSGETTGGETGGVEGEDQGGGHTPGTGGTTGGEATGATDTASLSAIVAPAVAKAENADRLARAQAIAGLAQQKAAQAAGATSGGSGEVGLGIDQQATGVYAGQTYNGNAQGLGAFTYNNGDLFAGQFEEGMISGLGVVSFSDKSRALGYAGQWAANSYSGFGAFYFADGSRLVGTWRSGQLNGPGARIAKDGKILEQGTFENSVLKPASN